MTKYWCPTCDIKLNTRKIMSAHIIKLKHQKNVKELYCEKIESEDEKEKYVKIFDENNNNPENEIKKELCYSKVRKEQDDGTFKTFYLCKDCSREFVKEDTLEKHIKNTCKVRKDKEFTNEEFKKLQSEDIQQESIDEMESLGRKIKIKDIFKSKDLDLQEKEAKQEEKENSISEEEALKPGYKEQEIPDLSKDPEKESFIEFQKLMHMAEMQGLSEEEQLYFVYQYQKKQRQETVSEIKHQYMLIRREEERQRITNAQKIALYSANEARNVLKQIQDQVSTLALLNKSTLRLTEEDIKHEYVNCVNRILMINENFSLRNISKVTKTPNTKFLSTINKNALNGITEEDMEREKNKPRKIYTKEDIVYESSDDEEMEDNVENEKLLGGHISHPEDINSEEVKIPIYKNFKKVSQEFYEEIDNLYKENMEIFNLYIKNNFIKFQHLFN